MNRSRASIMDRPAYRGGPAKQEKRRDNRAGHRTRSLENRTKRFPERCKYDENSTTNRRKLVLGQFGTIKVHSAVARDTPERLRSAKKLLRIRSESPRAAPRRSRKRPGSVLEAPGTPLGALEALKDQPFFFQGALLGRFKLVQKHAFSILVRSGA